LARSTGDGEEVPYPDAAKPPGSPADGQCPSLEVVERLGVGLRGAEVVETPQSETPSSRESDRT
jgi:hypothetical protein